MEDIKPNQFEVNTDHETKVKDSLDKINAFLDSLPTDIRESVEKELRSRQEVNQTSNNIPVSTEKTISNSEAALNDQNRIIELKNQLGTVNESTESFESDSEKILGMIDEFETEVKGFGFRVDRATSPAIRAEVTNKLKLKVNELYPLLKNVGPVLKNGDRNNDSSIDSTIYMLDGSYKGFNSSDSGPADLTRFASSILSNAKNIVFKIKESRK